MRSYRLLILISIILLSGFALYLNTYYKSLFNTLDPKPGNETISFYKIEEDLKDKKKIKWQECGNLDLCLISKENQFRRILDAVFKENNINPRVLIESNSMTHIYSHVNSSEFSTIMPYIFTQSFNYDETVSYTHLTLPTNREV